MMNNSPMELYTRISDLEALCAAKTEQNNRQKDRIAELEAQNKNLQFENNGMRELLQQFVLGYRQGRDLSAVYMDARTVLEKSA